jgi:NAD(P)-dependent dehydrogenase (short-subunit alcohol dehydrogenase family)
MDLGLGGATAVICGGSRGIGRAAGEALAAEGARVGVLSRPSEALDATVAHLLDCGSPEVLALPADLTDAAQVELAFALVGERWGTLNALVNTAGPSDVGVGHTVDDLDDAEWMVTLDVGLMTAVRSVRGALPLLRAADWARIVNVSAHSTKRQSPGMVAYTAAKAAMTSFSKNLAQTLAPEQILVNTVSPGSVLTEGMRGYMAMLGPERCPDPDDVFAVMRVIDEEFGHPSYLGRVGRPSELGVVIAFLVSRVNSYMTGADVNVDGGSDFA